MNFQFEYHEVRSGLQPVFPLLNRKILIYLNNRAASIIIHLKSNECTLSESVDSICRDMTRTCLSCNTF